MATAGFFVKYALMYVAFILFLTIGWLFSKNDYFKKFFAFNIFVFFVLPVMCTLIVTLYNSTKNTYETNVKNKEENNISLSFNGYCKGRNQIIYKTAKLTKNKTLSVRVETSFYGPALDYYAGALARHAKKLNKCNVLGVEHFEGYYGGQFVKNIGYTSEFLTFETCGQTLPKGKSVDRLSSDYELVIGEDSVKNPTPKLYDVKFMSKNSVKLIEKRTKTVLAQDTICCLQRDKGDAVCPYGYRQTYDMLEKVFGWSSDFIHVSPKTSTEMKQK